jgi:hypothetical protein
MRSNFRRSMSGRFGALACALGFGTAFSAPTTAVAQEGHFSVSIGSLAGATPKSGTAMISILRGGEIVAQDEIVLGNSSSSGWNSPALPVGIYDVRVAGEGLVTEVKHGIRNFDGQFTNVPFLTRPGSGIHVVEYATGGLAREEVAARLSALEVGLTKIQQPAGGLVVTDKAAGNEPCCSITAIDAKAGIATALDPKTKRSFQFRIDRYEPINGYEPINSARLLASLTMGQKVWADFTTQKVSIDGAHPCCAMLGASR